VDAGAIPPNAGAIPPNAGAIPPNAGAIPPNAGAIPANAGAIPANAGDSQRMRLTGLHHVTAICRDLDRTTRFYRDVLGLALVRETLNDDDPLTRHFYFGDARGSPGTLVSFLEYPSLPDGVVGAGSTHHFAFAVDSSDEQLAWIDYLRTRGFDCTDVFDRGAFRSIYVRDPDGRIVEIATREPGLLPEG
jgi:catechol 2,3-dioxygenase-like lactoylglutathione lyase family enzyme